MANDICKRRQNECYRLAYLETYENEYVANQKVRPEEQATLTELLSTRRLAVQAGRNKRPFDEFAVFIHTFNPSILVRSLAFITDLRLLSLSLVYHRTRFGRPSFWRHDGPCRPKISRRCDA
jgi:hypothetical protein